MLLRGTCATHLISMNSGAKTNVMVERLGSGVSLLALCVI